MFRLIKLEDRIVLAGDDVFNTPNTPPHVVASDPLPGMETVSPLPIPNQGKTPIFPLTAGNLLNYDISRHIVDDEQDPITYSVSKVEALDGGSTNWLENISFTGGHLLTSSAPGNAEAGKSYAVYFTADDKQSGHTPVSFVFKCKVETNTAPHENENPDKHLPDSKSPLLIPVGKPSEGQALYYDISPYITDTENDSLTYTLLSVTELNSGKSEWYQDAVFEGGRLKITTAPVKGQDEYKNFIFSFEVRDSVNTSRLSFRMQVIPNQPPEESSDNPLPTLSVKEGAGITHEVSKNFTDAENDTLKYSLTDIRDENRNLILTDKISMDESGKLRIDALETFEAGKTYTVNFTVDDTINDPISSSISIQIDPNSPPHESKSKPLPTENSPLELIAGQALNIDMSRYITDDEKNTLTYSLITIETPDGEKADWYTETSSGFTGSTLVTEGVPKQTDKDKIYIVHCKVRDDYNDWVSFSMPIRITGNSPPIPDSKTPLPGQEGEDVLRVFKGEALSYSMTQHFSDPDSGDTIRFVFDSQKIIAIDGGGTAWFDTASFDNTGNLKIPAPGTSEVGKSYVINFWMSDGVNVPQSYSIPIVIPNRAPEFTAEEISFSMQQNISSGSLLFKASSYVSDKDGDKLKYSIIGGDPDHRFEINPDTGELKLVNADLLKPADRFELKILAKEDKDNGLNAEKTFIINVVEAINLMPQENPADPKPMPLIWDTRQLSFVYDLSAHYTDPDKNTITFGNASTLAIVPFQADKAWKFELSADGILTGTLPEGESTGDYIIRFNINDGHGGVITDAVEIRFRNTNSAPMVYDRIYSIRETSYPRMPVGIVPASDPDGDILRYAIVPETDPDGIFSIDQTGMIRVIRPGLLDAQESPQIALKVRVEDTLKASSEATVTIHVEKSLRFPYPLKYVVGTSEDQAGGIFISEYDPISGKDNLIVILAEAKPGVTQGKIALLPGNRILYDPSGAFRSLAEGETKTDVFTYTITDGTAAVTAPVVVVVTGVNDPPTIGGIESVSDISDTGKIAPFAGFTISDIDVRKDGSQDAQTLTIWNKQPENGRLILSGGFRDNGDGSFSITGTPETVQQEVRNIVFEPVTVPSDTLFTTTEFMAAVNSDKPQFLLGTVTAGTTVLPYEAYPPEKVWIGTEIMIPYYGVSWKDIGSDILGLSIEHGLPIFTLKNLKPDDFDFGLPDETENIYELVNRMLREAKLLTDMDETMYPQKYSQEIAENADRNTEDWRIDIHPIEVR